MDRNNHENNPMQEAMRLAQDPAGQELIRLLKRQGGDELQTAMAQAAAGDYSQAKKAIQSLLDSPEARKLLKQLGGNP